MIKSTELCSYCNEEFDYEAIDKEALITCPHCGKITTQCNMCDSYKCEDCAQDRAAITINSEIECLKKDLVKFLLDKGYMPGRMKLTEDNVRRCQEAVATFFSNRDPDYTYNIKVTGTRDGTLKISITNNIGKEESKVEHKYFRGLVVPVEPKREWTWMKNTNKHCPSLGENCKDISCHHCIYSSTNHKTRSDFYDLTFGEPNQEQDFEIGDIVEYTEEYKSSLLNREFTVTTPILAVLIDKKTNSKQYLVYWPVSNKPRYLDLSKHKVKLIKKAK